MIRSFAFAAVLLLSVSSAAAQQPAPTTTAESDIVVVGERTEVAVRAFVSAMSAAPRSADQLARWHQRLCAGVAGLRGRYAQFVIDRMAQRAFELDLNVGEPGCDPNVLIVVTSEPDAVARELYEDHPAALGYFGNPGEATRGRTALRASFLNSDAPVRWWHVSHRTSVAGSSIERASAAPCAGGDALDIASCFATNPLGGGSRLRSPTTEGFGAAFVIVDANRLVDIGYDFNALADYLAMVTLAQLDPQVDVTSFPSVLNLWRNAGGASEGMTDWDLDYLRGLYSSQRDAASVSRHEADIARGMVRERNAE